jgi:hypothetical protein
VDPKYPNQILPRVSAPTPAHAKAVATDAEHTSPKTNPATNADAEKFGVVELSTDEAVAPKKSGLTEVLDRSRAELDRLLLDTQTIHERSWRVIHTLLEDSQLRASRAVDACLARFEKDIQDHISSAMSVAMENLDIEAGARVAAHLDQALSLAKQRQRSIEQDLAVAVAANRKQLDQISTAAADGLGQRHQKLLGDLQTEAERQNRELVNSASQLWTNIQRLAETLESELKEHTEQAVRTFQSRTEEVWQELLDRAENRIADAAHTSTAELAKEARRAVEREMSEFLGQALARFNHSSGAQSSNQDG